ncbi:MAG: stage II sporulation protein M [Clostridia bacterium]
MKVYIRNYLYQNRVEYLKAFMVFVIGIIVAIIVVNNSNESQKNEIKEYVDNKIEVIKSSDYDNKFEVFKNSFFNNFESYIVIVFLASTIIGIPFVYLYIAKKAFSIGYAACSIMATQNTRTGIIFICNSMLFHNIIYLASIFIVLVSGVLFTKSIFENKNLKLEVFRYIIFSLIGLICIFMSSLCEAYISINFLYLLKKYL